MPRGRFDDEKQQQPVSGWVGVFPVSLFFFFLGGGVHVSWVGMG